MALVQTVLKSALVSAFRDMVDASDGNAVFAEKVSAVAADYAGTGNVTTVDAGAIPSGVFAGAGAGSFSCDASAAESIISAACGAMNAMETGGNEYLAAQMASGFNAMFAAGSVETTVTGTVTPPSAPPVPFAGSASGTLTGVPAAMQAAFLAAFTAMNDMAEGGDDYMAGEIAAAVDTYLKSAVITTQGSGTLAGSTGTGKML
jgi:hypothetical protein